MHSRITDLENDMKTPTRFILLLATLLMVAVYMIPHSALGSELDYRTGEIRTGK